jgi:hypothetical protein
MSADMGFFAMLAGVAALAAVGMFLAIAEASELSRALGVACLAIAAALALLSAGQIALALAACVAGIGHIIVVAALAARAGAPDAGEL